MEIIADNPIKDSLQSLLTEVTEENLALVFLDMEDPVTHRRVPNTGIGKALEKAAENKPVLMIGWLTPEHYAADPRWQEFKQYPHAIFRRLPLGKQEILAAFSEAKSQLSS